MIRRNRRNETAPATRYHRSNRFLLPFPKRTLLYLCGASISSHRSLSKGLLAVAVADLRISCFVVGRLRFPPMCANGGAVTFSYEGNDSAKLEEEPEAHKSESQPFKGNQQTNEGSRGGPPSREANYDWGVNGTSKHPQRGNLAGMGKGSRLKCPG